MPTMNEIETRARTYSEARAKLAEYVATLNQGVEALQREYLPKVKRALNRAAELEAEIRAMVEAQPDLFVKPKTVILHGIKLGYEKGKGAIEFADPETVVALIERKLPDLAEQLVKVTKKPLKAGLRQLTVQQLKAIGCTVEETGDQVVVRAVDTAVDKLVNALLKSALAEQEEPQGA